MNSGRCSLCITSLHCSPSYLYTHTVLKHKHHSSFPSPKQSSDIKKPYITPRTNTLEVTQRHSNNLVLVGASLLFVAFCQSIILNQLPNLKSTARTLLHSGACWALRLFVCRQLTHLLLIKLVVVVRFCCAARPPANPLSAGPAVPEVVAAVRAAANAAAFNGNMYMR